MTDDTSARDPVMPFPVCASQGGPYDDAAFVAGYELGALDAHLAALVAAGFDGTFLRTVRAASLPQVAVLAMRHGFYPVSEPVYDQSLESAQLLLRRGIPLGKPEP